MLKKALDKLEAEVTAADKDDGYTPYIASFLMEHVRQHPQDAVLIIADNKTIKGSLKHMEDEARKKQKNNRAMFSPEQGKAVILKYYGINANEPKVVATVTTSFTASLDDIL